jgi:tRNA 2-thiouridine synthesizing protein B
MLHIVNKSHMQTSSLQSCLRLAKPGSALLLIEDAVYAATKAGAAACSMADAMRN